MRAKTNAPRPSISRCTLAMRTNICARTRIEADVVQTNHPARVSAVYLHFSFRAISSSTLDSLRKKVSLCDFQFARVTRSSIVYDVRKSVYYTYFFQFCKKRRDESKGKKKKTIRSASSVRTSIFARASSFFARSRMSRFPTVSYCRLFPS